MKNYKNKILATTILMVLIASAAVGFYFMHRSESPISTSIKKQAGFSVLEPQAKSAWSVSPKSVAYDGGAAVLTMTATNGSNNLIISEQSEPEAFTESPQVYPALLNKMNQYTDLQTSLGKVTLTHPKELNGLQAAVLDLKQTLIFVKPHSNLTQDQWKAFFDSMQWDS